MAKKSSMQNLTSLKAEERRVLREMRELLFQARNLSEKVPISLKKGVDTLVQIRSTIYENLNQLLHQAAILRAAKRIETEEGSLSWLWHPKQTSGRGEADLEGRRNGVLIAAAEVTTSARPKGTISTTLKGKLAYLSTISSQRRIYVVTTTAMETYALARVAEEDKWKSIEVFHV